MYMTNIFIDNISSYIYRANLVTYSVGCTRFQVDTIQSVAAITRHILSCNEGTRDLSVTLEINDKTEHEALMRLSRLTAAMTGQHMYRIGDGYLYDAILTEISEIDQELKNRIYCTFTFDAIRCGNQEQISFSDSSIQFICSSTAQKTPIRLEIYPNKAIEQLSIMGMNIYDLKVGDCFVIDSVKKTVTSNGKNAFDSVTLVDNTDFPTLQSGMNEVHTNTPVQVKLSYYPIYI